MNRKQPKACVVEIQEVCQDTKEMNRHRHSYLSSTSDEDYINVLKGGRYPGPLDEISESDGAYSINRDGYMSGHLSDDSAPDPRVYFRSRDPLANNSDSGGNESSGANDSSGSTTAPLKKANKGYKSIEADAHNKKRSPGRTRKSSAKRRKKSGVEGDADTDAEDTSMKARVKGQMDEMRLFLRKTVSKWAVTGKWRVLPLVTVIILVLGTVAIGIWLNTDISVDQQTWHGNQVDAWKYLYFHKEGTDTHRRLIRNSTAVLVIRTFFMVFALMIWGLLIADGKSWLICTYTVQSWTWLTIRWTLSFIIGMHAYCGGSSDARFIGALVGINEAVRFTCISQNFIACCIWWVVLVPFAACAIRSRVERLRRIAKRKREATWVGDEAADNETINEAKKMLLNGDQDLVTTASGSGASSASDSDKPGSGNDIQAFAANSIAFNSDASNTNNNSTGRVANSSATNTSDRANLEEHFVKPSDDNIHGKSTTAKSRKTDAKKLKDGHSKLKEGKDGKSDSNGNQVYSNVSVVMKDDGDDRKEKGSAKESDADADEIDRLADDLEVELHDVWSWNFSPTTVILHGFNFMPIAILEPIFINPRPLLYMDLWFACAIAIVYLCFYLFILDSLFGLQFYALFNVRSNWSAPAFLCTFFLYWVLYVGVNFVTSYMELPKPDTVPVSFLQKILGRMTGNN